MSKLIQNSIDGKNWIKKCVSNGVDRSDICSAYIRSEALKFFFSEMFDTKAEMRVLARWAAGDLLSKSSDLASYEICKSKNIDFYIKQDFHGKLYSLAPHGILIGSFNMTNRGFSISQEGNDEAGVLIEHSIESEKYFENLFSNSRKVDDELYEKISEFVDSNAEKKISNATWSEEITDLISPKEAHIKEKILVNECLLLTFNDFINGQSRSRTHDLSLLSIDEENVRDLAAIRAGFRKSKIFGWIFSVLNEQKEIYFGEATALLHNQLFDDPKPYRQEVKGLLANLLSWIEGLSIEEISIDRPNHSQRIALNK